MNLPFHSAAIRRRRLPSARLGAGLLLALALAGCTSPSAIDDARVGPFHQPANHAGDAQLPQTLRRVVVLPIAGGAVAPAESTLALDSVFIAALQKENRFEVVPVSRDECRQYFHVDEFGSTAALPHDFMATLRRHHAADAVLFIDVTVFKPYRPLALGVRAKLATLGDEVRLLWSFDNVFSADDPAVANSARRHYLDSDRRDGPADPTLSVLHSPTRFAGYVAAETFATLPPVYTPPPPPRKKWWE